jgi:hypothetical protein
MHASVSFSTKFFLQVFVVLIIEYANDSRLRCNMEIALEVFAHTFSDSLPVGFDLVIIRNHVQRSPQFLDGRRIQRSHPST